jgi:hypothetical protein
LEIYGLGGKEYNEREVVGFVRAQGVRFEGEVDWGRWRGEISSEEAKNRWMILKRHIQGRGEKSLGELLEMMGKRLG